MIERDRTPVGLVFAILCRIRSEWAAIAFRTSAQWPDRECCIQICGVSARLDDLPAVGIGAMEIRPGKPGPKPKGKRFRVTAALPEEVVTMADDIARQQGVDRTAVLGRLLCERLGLPVPAYCLPPSSDQEELPLSKAS